ncbi:MAG: HEAT repeat domain-containing protein, partial [Candidatus Hydrogenedentes bacterium]|nr:HEAT repeat domain-containing protein [Candidatus Hydrogenedentota bacterium]
YEAMRALTDEKAEAAVFALNRMGGDDVHKKMLEMLEKTEGLEWFRVLRVLYALGDEGAKTLMLEEALRQPAYRRTAGLLLAADGIWEGTQFLRTHLEKAEDQNLENLIYKARVASTLFLMGDFQQKILLQELVNMPLEQIYARGRTSDTEFKRQIAVKVQRNAIDIIARMGSPDLLSLLVGPIESSGPQVAITACRAAMAIGNPEFGRRLMDGL